MQVTLTVQQLPDIKVGESYSCQFDDLPLTQGTTTGNTIKCMTPLMSDIPAIPTMGNSSFILVISQLPSANSSPQSKFLSWFIEKSPLWLFSGLF